MVRIKTVTIGLLLGISLLFGVNTNVAAKKHIMAQARRKVVLFDLGYTLVNPEPSMISAIKTLGLGNLISCILCDFTIFAFRSSIKDHMHRFMMETLDKIPSPTAKKDSTTLLGPDGKRLPSIYRDYMLGTITYQQALDQIKQHANKHPEWFGSDAKKQLFLGMIKVAYDPEIYTHGLQLNPVCTHLLQYCARQGCLCIVISNWAREWVPEFKQKFCMSITPYVKEWVFSCDGHGAKPCASIFEHCYNLVRKKHPEYATADWYFFDDQDEHRKSAKKVFRPLFEANEKNQQIHCSHPQNAESFARKHHLICDHVTRFMLNTTIDQAEQQAYEHELERRRLNHSQNVCV